jgi:hypothetical protein
MVTQPLRVPDTSRGFSTRAERQAPVHKSSTSLPVFDPEQQIIMVLLDAR